MTLPMTDTPPLVVLASASPRRSALLTQIAVAHTVRATEVDESALAGESPDALVRRLARAKAIEGRRSSPPAQPALPVLGADTIVVLDGVVFGKPVDKADGVRMLLALGGHTHHVLTAVALAMPGISGEIAEAISDTAVTMRPVTVAEAEGYWTTGEPAGKAGGYAIQGRGAGFIAHIDGSYSGVMGLPLYETVQLLQAHGLYAAAPPQIMQSFPG
jgi:septum formation protein